MAKFLITTATDWTPCGNVHCGVTVAPGDALFPARLRPDVYCSSLCRNRHSRRLVQDRRRADPAKNRRDNDKRIERKYGLTQEEYTSRLEQQGHSCAICGKQFSGDRPHVDHDHDTGQVRGILCGSCNVGLGYFYDNAEFLLSAVAYLSRDTASASSVVEQRGGDAV